MICGYDDSYFNGHQLLYVTAVGELITIPGLQLKTISSTQLKSRNYNYYFLNNDIEPIHKMFTRWKRSNPLVLKGANSYMWIYMNNCSDYDWAIKFDSVYY